MIVGAAEEAEAVGQDLQRAFAVHQAVELHPLLENLEDQVLLLDAGDIGEVVLAGLLDQFGHRHPLQLGDVGVARLLDLLVARVDFVAHGPPSAAISSASESGSCSSSMPYSPSVA